VDVRSAAILTPDLGPNLPAHVEAALPARDTQQGRLRWPEALP
jgi:hypothetical protein